MSIELSDCTLRDGAYVNEGVFGFETIKNIVSGLNNANFDIVELGWLTNEAFSKGTTFFGATDEIDEILPSNKKAQFAIMTRYENFDLKKIPKNKGKIDIIRELFKKNEYKEAIYRSEIIKNLGYKLFYQAVDTNEYNNVELMELSGLANKIMPDCLYIVDTHGGMFREDLKRVFEILSENLDDKIKIGFHSHNNLQLSFSLSIDFIEFAKSKKRDIIIDSTLFGMGRGAGNLNSELIGEYLNKFYFKNYDMNIVNNLINSEILKFKKNSNWGYNVSYLLAGTYNIHSRYAKYLTEKYNVSPEILREVFGLLEGADGKIFNKEKAEKAYKSIV